MSKRVLSVVASGALLAAAFVAAPARADSSVPPEVQITDPRSDANFLNDQGFRRQMGFQGDRVTDRDWSAAADLTEVWFSHDLTSISINFQVRELENNVSSILYQAFTNPGGSPYQLGCLRWAALLPSVSDEPASTYRGSPYARLIDRCRENGDDLFNNGVNGKVSIGDGVVTATFPRYYSTSLQDGRRLEDPFAETRLAVGAGTAAGYLVLDDVVIDNTKVGSDYYIASPDETVTIAAPPAGSPGFNDPPGNGKKNGCSKGKGKKKGACPGRKDDSDSDSDGPSGGRALAL